MFINNDKCNHPSYTSESITDELNQLQVVKAESTFIPYIHCPLENSVWVYQAEGEILRSDETYKYLCTLELASCQAIIIRNTKTKMTGLFHLDQWFKRTDSQSVKDTLSLFSTDTGDITVRIVINQNYFGINEKHQTFIRSYGCTIDNYLQTLSSLFETAGVIPEILRIGSRDIRPALRKYLSHDVEYKDLSIFILESIFQRLSLSVPSSLCVSTETGDLFWWFLPLNRVYPCDENIIKSFDVWKDLKRFFLEAKVRKGKGVHELMQEFIKNDFYTNQTYSLINMCK